MLAVFTTDSLVCLDSPTLKRPPPSTRSSSSLSSPPVCCTWAPDNSSLFLATSTDIQQFSSAGAFQTIVHTSNAVPATALVSKDKGNTLIFSSGAQMHTLETHSGKLVQNFDMHKAPITALALSHDGSLLASTSAAAAQVHNLTHGAHTILRGLPAGAGAIATCAFHPHSRTRLLLGAGPLLLVYDTTRPSGPVKSVSLTKDKGCSGDIVAIASSPFSKTLIAVASSGGTIGLVDLDKEKGLFRVLSLHVPLTALVFSSEGAALYAGTENGKVFVQELRALDKPPKAIAVSDIGSRVVAMCIQKKLKAGEASPAKPLVPQDTNKDPARRIVESPATATPENTKVPSAKPPTPDLPRSASGVLTPVKARATSGRTRTRGPSSSGAAAAISSGHRVGAMRSPGRKVSAGITKRVFSPPRIMLVRAAAPTAKAEKDNDEGEEHDALNMSVSIDDLLTLQKPSKAKENVNPIERALVSAVTAKSAAAAISAVAEPSRTATKDDEAARSRTRTTSSRSSASISATASASTTSRRTRTTTGASTLSSLSSATDVHAKKLLSCATGSRTVLTSNGATSSRMATMSPLLSMPAERKPKRARSRTPSPAFPDLDADLPVTPHRRAKGKGKERMDAGGMGVLGLGTPEVQRWVRAGEGSDADADINGRRVGFAVAEDDDQGGRGVHLGVTGNQPEMAMQLSPRCAPVVSPLRRGGPGSPHSAQDLLQTLLRDALYDFRRETRAEMVGLHLDLVRMGRGWRHEMRDAMAEFSGEIRALREENALLRQENERLKRGY